MTYLLHQLLQDIPDVIFSARTCASTQAAILARRFDHLLLVSPRCDDVISRARASVQCGVSEVNCSAIYTYTVCLSSIFTESYLNYFHQVWYCVCVCLQTLIFKESYYLNRLSGSINTCLFLL